MTEGGDFRRACFSRAGYVLMPVEPNRPAARVVSSISSGLMTLISGVQIGMSTICATRSPGAKVSVLVPRLRSDSTRPSSSSARYPESTRTAIGMRPWSVASPPRAMIKRPIRTGRLLAWVGRLKFNPVGNRPTLPGSTVTASAVLRSNPPSPGNSRSGTVMPALSAFFEMVTPSVLGTIAEIS